MKKMAISVIVLCMLVFGGVVEKGAMKNIAIAATEPDDIVYNVTMKQDLFCLMMAYPEYITNVERKTDGRVYIVMKSGKRILYDDKKVKNFQEKLNNADLQDMMEQRYPLSDITKLMDIDFNPGRIRVYPLLKEVYGGGKEQVQSNLVPVKLGYKTCLFNGNNKAADALQSVMKELTPLSQKRHDIYSCVFPTNGTFNYRCIAGTNRLSPHSFGTAIDLKSDKRDYWKWTSRKDGEKRLSIYPREIVQIFEKNNFIWGGKWGKFDILHFEYRPELILKSRYFADKPASDKSWYDGISCKDESVKKCIEIIDKVLE
ncbi:M15 family metallopeptidase [Clostridium ganghwense]|uniref:M15 family metallopeptidase n=1 Tax=Clostridium ganghwense TaxID=312089 RepID=A0ABT4CQ22_9CLOT|nr:M15 family metallopeptidase [Clostridium ganghwense]MCY6371151.1 M15 family metallopeptidase [Clostridium ganghwense]